MKSSVRASPATVAVSAQLDVTGAALEHVARVALAVGHRCDRRTGAALGVVGHRRGRGRELRRADPFGAARSGADAGRVGGELGPQVGAALGRVSHLGDELVDRIGVEHRGAITTPSSSSVCESAGIEPGTRPPTSAWWARLAAKPISVSPANAGVMTVMSGRWVPPANGSLRTHARSGAWSSPTTAATAAGIAPRWTGMCSACMTISPAGSNSAVEQSRRSLMLAEWAARTSVAPISSHAARRAPVVTASAIGSSSVIASRSMSVAPGRARPGAPAVGDEQRRLAEVDDRGAVDRGRCRRSRSSAIGGPSSTPVTRSVTSSISASSR